MVRRIAPGLGRKGHAGEVLEGVGTALQMVWVTSVHVGMLDFKRNDMLRGTYLVGFFLAKLRLPPVLQDTVAPPAGQALQCLLQQAKGGPAKQRHPWVLSLSSSLTCWVRKQARNAATARA